jgi:hypothetical protein
MTSRWIKVDNKTGIRIGMAFDGNVQIKIVSVPVGVGTFPEYGIVLFDSPVRIVEFMGCVEMLFARYIQQWLLHDFFRVIRMGYWD